MFNHPDVLSAVAGPRYALQLRIQLSEGNNPMIDEILFETAKQRHADRIAEANRDTLARRARRERGRHKAGPAVRKNVAVLLHWLACQLEPGHPQVAAVRPAAAARPADAVWPADAVCPAAAALSGNAARPGLDLGVTS
jgi:hypothetical protein